MGRGWGDSDPGRSGEKRERVDVRRPDDRKMTALERRDVRFAEPLGRGDDRRVPWIAGCERRRAHLVDECERAGFTPQIAYTTDDMVLMQALVAAGLGVTMIPRARPTVAPRKWCRRDRDPRIHSTSLCRNLRRTPRPTTNCRADRRATKQPSGRRRRPAFLGSDRLSRTPHPRRGRQSMYARSTR
jgi:DNA-binding transcriptional LysR family regulator